MMPVNNPFRGLWIFAAVVDGSLWLMSFLWPESMVSSRIFTLFSLVVFVFFVLDGLFSLEKKVNGTMLSMWEVLMIVVAFMSSLIAVGAVIDSVAPALMFVSVVIVGGIFVVMIRRLWHSS